jgi:uncharacterized protein (DUF2235 family)
MAKNVVIFSDGTGQGAAVPQERRTNVRKLWDATKAAAPDRQVAFYDPGLGSADEMDHSWRRRAHDLVSRLTGLGISRNIKDCYAAIIENYQPGDRIFLFGFSRGAYTVRSMASVLTLCGVPQHDAAGKSVLDKAVRDALVDAAVETVYKCYGGEATEKKREARGAAFRAKYGGNLAGTAAAPVPYFIGVWDTVRAIGVPGSGSLFLWRHAFHSAALDPRVPYARQALSIDENRRAFKPELWEETAADRASGRIKQVWFPGVHSDVGGGYAESELSDLALDWMIREATSIAEPLIVDMTQLALKPSYQGLQHDERIGMGRIRHEGTREGYKPDILYEPHVGNRFKLAVARYVTGDAPYRPRALRAHPDYKHLY